MESDGPQISVVVPVRDGAPTLDRCLAALHAAAGPGDELVVVDDGSRDATPAIIAAHRPHVHLVHARPIGAETSRNEGAEAARGGVLFFTDADVVVRADTLEKVRRHFRDPVCEAVIGLYAAEHPNPGLWSVYKNAWIRFTYLAASGEVDWFFTAVGAVRRTSWERAGRFDARYTTRTGAGDMDFGRRLRERGGRIRLDKTLDVVHLRSFTLGQLLGNDLMRAYGYARYGLLHSPGPLAAARRGVGNVDARFVGGAALAALTALCAALPPLWPALAVLPPAHLWANLPFLRYARRELGLHRAASFAPLIFVDQLASAIGAGAALVARAAGR